MVEEAFSSASEHYELVEKCCEQIAQKLGIHLAGSNAYSFILGAHTAVMFWEHANACGLRAKEKRIRRQRFFTFIGQAHEIVTGLRAGLTWNRTEGCLQFAGEFFAMAKICHDSLLPPELRAGNDVALGKLVHLALKRRTSDTRPRKSAGRKRQFPPA
jgi:hypothetical protein